MSSFRHRQATRADAAAVAGLVAGLEAALLGSTDYSLAELEEEWRKIDVERDAWVVEDEAGRVVGYGTVELVEELGKTDGYVHPDVWRRGVGTALAEGLESEVAARGADRAQNAVLAADARAHALLRGLGYDEVRRFWQMRIQLAEPPVPPRWPEGLTVSRPTADDLPAIHAALEEAFADHWNHTFESYERFRQRFVDRDDFDPSLWVVVRDGGEIVAGTLCEPERMGAGWVSRLFTRRPWRGRGIGAALLADAFGRFWEHGQRTVGLGVDAQSDTGAQRLYERAGMHVHRGAVVFEKPLAG